jgi:signal transduction histidine kinase
MCTADMRPSRLQKNVIYYEKLMPKDFVLLLTGLGLGWISLILGLVLFHRVRGWLRKNRYGEPVNYGLLLVEYGRRLTEVQHLEALEILLVEEIPHELGILRTILLLPVNHQLVSVSEENFRLPISHAAVRWVASGGEAQKSNQGQLLKLIQQGRTDILWTQVWVPLMRGTRLQGMWLLGGREEKRQYSPEDLRCLTSIARETAAVLEAMTFAEQEHQTAAEIRALYRQVVTAREGEHSRLSRELHDGILQDLCAVTRDLRSLETQSESHDSTYSALVNLSSGTVKSLRAICNDLRPPLLQRDLIAAMKALVQELDSRSDAPVHIDSQVQDLQLDDEAALAVFRIMQEALNNAIQHADASEIAVRLTQYPDRLRLTVTDDGQGISGGIDSARFVARGHFGIAGMHERAAMVGGKLDVQTAVDYGTVVILELPM